MINEYGWYVDSFGNNIYLTLSEMRLLKCLLQNKDNIVTYKTLSKYMTGEDYFTIQNENNIRVVIYKLRKKLGYELDIKSRKGLGYILTYRGESK